MGPVRRDYVAGVGGGADLIAYGHYGRPLLAFPSQEGRATDYEDRGMINALAPLIDGGRVKVYCVDSFDGGSWHHGGLSLEERARRHLIYEDWILNAVVPWIHGDSGGAAEIITTGSSFGAYHAVNFAFRRADLFPVAIGMSGVYDVSVLAPGTERGDTFYFNNPMDYVTNLHGDHLGWLQRQLTIVLVCGQGAWEDSTGALDSTRRFGDLLAAKGIRHEVDLWGWDTPHDWPSWRAQIAHQLPRFL
jgi:esterase/lipase superfamily enzyme